MRDIDGYEGCYQICENGDIFSLPRKGTIKNKMKICQRVNKYGYVQVVLMKNNKRKTFLVHRLVANAFVNNDSNLKVVNHIDGNKTNNNANNLEWCSVSENTKHAYRNNLGNFREHVMKNLNNMNKDCYKHIVLEKYGESYVFSSSSDAAKFINTDKDNITRAFRFNQKCKGYKVSCFRTANGES